MTTITDQPRLFGHPTGLFTLFFAEMWERFSYYGMRALLTFYMIKGFLGYNDKQAYAVYGAYTALVYMTPYFGGMLADRLLGQKRAVILGGLLMAGGHLIMGVENDTAFFVALALLTVGNGFFKPNISTMVGSMYPQGSQKKDAGFTIFYMGINLGAAMSPVICGYVGETYGWHYGFGLATVGMLIGVAIFAVPTAVTRMLILAGAIATAIAMPFFQDTALQLIVRLFLGGALVTAALISFKALSIAGLPKELGGAPDEAKLKEKIGGIISIEWAVYACALLSVPVFMLLVQKNAMAGWVLNITGIIALALILKDAFTNCTKVERERIYVVVVMIFFSLLFWAFFEQAGSSVNNFTDRNIDRVIEERNISEDQVGKTITFRLAPATEDAELAKLLLLGQEQLGHENGHASWQGAVATAVTWQEKKAGKLKDKEIAELLAGLAKHETMTMFAMTALRALARDEKATPEQMQLDWVVLTTNVGMGVGGSEIPASEFQAANPIYILLFGLVFTALWGFLASRKKDPSTPVKFALGLLQLGLGFGAFWYGAEAADGRGMTSMTWLLLGYLLMTTGELCLSPVGLSMVTKLSPKRMVSTVMGAWFLATAFSNYLAAVIAQFTGVGHGGEESVLDKIIPPPLETVSVYGDVFGILGMIAIGSAVFLFLLAPMLTKWMHTESFDSEASDS